MDFAVIFGSGILVGFFLGFPIGMNTESYRENVTRRGAEKKNRLR